MALLADLICIPHRADYEITLLMHRFSPSKIDGTDEQKGTGNLAYLKEEKKLNKSRGRVID